MTAASYTIFVHGLTLPCIVGVFEHEHTTPQRVRFSVDVAMAAAALPAADNIDAVLSYDTIVAGIHALVEKGHVQLVETWAQRIATLALSDTRTQRVEVMVEKLDVLPDGAVVGVRLVRTRD